MDKLSQAFKEAFKKEALLGTVTGATAAGLTADDDQSSVGRGTSAALGSVAGEIATGAGLADYEYRNMPDETRKAIHELDDLEGFRKFIDEIGTKRMLGFGIPISLGGAYGGAKIYDALNNNK